MQHIPERQRKRVVNGRNMDHVLAEICGGLWSDHTYKHSIFQRMCSSCIWIYIAFRFVSFFLLAWHMKIAVFFRERLFDFLFVDSSQADFWGEFNFLSSGLDGFWLRSLLATDSTVFCFASEISHFFSLKIRGFYWRIFLLVW